MMLLVERTYTIFKRINEYIDEENYERAQKDLETFERYCTKV